MMAAVATQVRRKARVLIVAAVSVAVLVLGLGALFQRSTPNLAPWHTAELDGEFRAKDVTADFDWNDYLRLEEELFRELEVQVVEISADLAHPIWNRFAPGGGNNPTTFPVNWNRSYELKADGATGGALLIHGLTDSPYSLRRPAEILHERGFHVVGLRLPGHGTVPSALKDASVADWRAAVSVAVRHLQETVGDSSPLWLVGYSNGGALALDLTLDSLNDQELRVPDRVVLFSPAVGITRAAVLARMHHVLSFLPYYEKLAWNSVLPEYDPFKYNSFPTDAGYETHVLTRSVRSRLEELQKRGATADFPPVLTFMSLADATVHVEAVVSGLYDRLGRPADELVVFDVNYESGMRGFFRADPAKRLQTLVDRETTPYRLTVISNRADDSLAVVERTRPAGETGFEITDLGMEWPPGVYSLSHVAVQFPPDDPVYGFRPGEGGHGLQLGALEPRGERGLLSVSVAQLTRLRSNPFFPYVEARLWELIPDTEAGE
jgi:alpha-beta hydrolase superfamily lysophospholipase